MAPRKKNKDPLHKVVADNRSARFHYALGEKIEAGIMLHGTEVKSLRQGRVNLSEAYVGIQGSDVFLINSNIPEYLQANRFNHEMRRPRKLLLHRQEINRLLGKTREKGFSLVPLKIYFARGKAKVELVLASGKKLYDKRQDLAERDAKRDMERALRDRQKE